MKGGNLIEHWLDTLAKAQPERGPLKPATIQAVGSVPVRNTSGGRDFDPRDYTALVAYWAGYASSRANERAEGAAGDADEREFWRDVASWVRSS